MRVSLMITCLADVLRPAAGRAVVNILRRLGHEVNFPESQTCCGQPMFNSGLHRLAAEQAQHTIKCFEASDVVVTPSGSCAAMVKVEFPRLLSDEPQWAERARELAARTHEFSDFLVNRLGQWELGARYPGRVAYHYACHLRLLNQTNEVQRLIEHIDGATYVELDRQDQCCGFGGSFAVRYPQISGALVDDKMQCVLRTDANALVSTDTGCLMNIGGRLHREGHRVEVLHIAELLDRV